MHQKSFWIFKCGLKEYVDLDKEKILSKIKVITLCGSAKFMKEFKEVETNLTLKGVAVLSPIFFEQRRHWQNFAKGCSAIREHPF
jgi:hypothetical protein